MRTGKNEELTKLIGRRLKDMLGSDDDGPMDTSAAIWQSLEALRRTEEGRGSASDEPSTRAASNHNDADAAMFSENVSTSSKMDVD